jgi:hypothetical protein
VLTAGESVLLRRNFDQYAITDMPSGPRPKHGHAGGKNKSASPTYQSWQDMLKRCFNQKRPEYSNYGGRGITVCCEWLQFENFLRDMGEKPIGLSLGRIRNEGNYEPSNCRWETREEQNNNTRRNRLITIDGETKTVAMWARHKGVKVGVILTRLCRGGLDYDAVMKPKRRSPKPKPSVPSK